MSFPRTPDPRRDEAASMPMRAVVDKLGIPALIDNNPWLSGPCPNCGDYSRSDSNRFNINVQDGGFFCRKQCGFKGNGPIDLTMRFLGVSFPEALTELCGAQQANVDPKLAAERKRRMEESARKSEEASKRYRQGAIDAAVRIWKSAKYDPQSKPILDYLETRGIPRSKFAVLPKCLRFHPELPYVKKLDGEWVEIHKGPAMVAAVQMPDGKLRSVHRTWLDRQDPKGKAKIRLGDVVYQSKTMLGSKKGGAIRLFTPEGATTLVMGEGIETTLTAWAAQPYENAAYWAGADLGNMAGKMANARKRDGVPLLSDDRAFVPPTWVRRLVLIQDGDSDPELTRAQLLSCLHRAMHHLPKLEGFIVHAGEGRDLNDILNAGKPTSETTEDKHHD